MCPTRDRMNIEQLAKLSVYAKLKITLTWNSSEGPFSEIVEVFFNSLHSLPPSSVILYRIRTWNHLCNLKPMQNVIFVPEFFPGKLCSIYWSYTCELGCIFRMPDIKSCHCKKRLTIFPFPAGMSLSKLCLDGKKEVTPGQGEFV